MYKLEGDLPPMGCWEFWSILCAIVACTSRVELGTLAMGMGFRNPALLAKMADTLDESATADESSALWWKDMPFSDDVGQVEPLPGAPSRRDCAVQIKTGNRSTLAFERFGLAL